MTRSVLDRINWAPPMQFVNPVQEYMRGAEFRAQQEAAKRQGEIQQLQLERAKERTAEELATVDRGKEYMANRMVLQSVGNLQRVANEAPQMYAGAYQAEVGKLRQALPPQFSQNLPDQPIAPGMLGKLAEGVQGNLARLTAKPQAQQEPHSLEERAAVLLSAKHGRQFRPVPIASQHPEWGPTIERLAAEDAKKGTTTITNQIPSGNDPATMARRTAHQTAIDDAKDRLATIGDIEALGDPAQYLGWFRRAEFWGKDKVAQAGLVNALPAAEREQFEKASQFRSVVDKYRATEFNRLIGASQTQAEVKNLVNSILNADMNEVQFRAALSTLKRTEERAMRFSQEALDKGYDLGSDDYNKHMAASFKGARRDERTALLEEMKGQPKEAIIEAALKRGLMDEAEAKRLLEGDGG